VRGGPGLGNIAAAQSDYFQVTRGGGHGDYYSIVLAPWSVQEVYDHTIMAFELADRYRLPAIVLADAVIGQMMEPLELHEVQSEPVEKPWALSGCGDRQRNVITSLYVVPDEMEEVNLRIRRRFDATQPKEIRWDEFQVEDAQILLVAYGTSARVCRTAVEIARDRGIAAGLIRPITVSPFPTEAVHRAAAKAGTVLVVEMSLGQMVQDVQLAAGTVADIHFLGRTGGNIPYPDDVLDEIQKLIATGPVSAPAEGQVMAE